MTWRSFQTVLALCGLCVLVVSLSCVASAEPREGAALATPAKHDDTDHLGQQDRTDTARRSPDNEGSNPPLADAGLDRHVEQNETVYLDAGGSVALTGQIERYEWEIDPPEGTTFAPECTTCPQTQFQPRQPGTYAVTVTVTDSAGGTASDTLYVYVDERRGPAVTLAGPDRLRVGQPGAFTLSARPRTHPLESVNWYVDETFREYSFLDAEGARTTRVGFTSAGRHTVSASVFDTSGLSTTATATVLVGPPPTFAVAIDRVRPPRETGTDELTVRATVTNAGNFTDSQDIRLVRAGTELDHRENLTLAPGASATVTLSWADAIANPGTHTLRVASDTDNDTAAAVIGFEDGTSTPRVVTVPGVPTAAPDGETLEVALKDRQFEVFATTDIPAQVYVVYPYNATAFPNRTAFYESMARRVGAVTGLRTFEAVRDNASLNVSEDAWHGASLGRAIAEWHGIQWRGEGIPDSSAEPFSPAVMDGYVVRLTGEGAPIDVSEALVPSTNASVPTAAVAGTLSQERVKLSSVDISLDGGGYNTLEATATVENPTQSTVTRRIALTTNGTRIEDTPGEIDTDSVTSVTLEPGETARVTLKGRNRNGDVVAGPTTVAVSAWAWSDALGARGGPVRLDDRVATALTPSAAILPGAVAPGRTAVTDLTARYPAGGDSLTVVATVTNPGDDSVTSPVALVVDGTRRATKTVTLAAGTSETLTWSVTGPTAGVEPVVVTTNTSRARRYVLPSGGRLVSQAPANPSVTGNALSLRPDERPGSERRPASTLAPNDLVVRIGAHSSAPDVKFPVTLTKTDGDPVGVTDGPVRGTSPLAPTDAQEVGVAILRAAGAKYNNINNANGINTGIKLIDTLYNVIGAAFGEPEQVRDTSGGTVTITEGQLIEIKVFNNNRAVERFNRGKTLSCGGSVIDIEGCAGARDMRLPYHGLDFFTSIPGATARFTGSDAWTSKGGTYSRDGNTLTLNTTGMEDSDGDLTDGETLVINSDRGPEQLDVAAGEVIGLDGANWRFRIEGISEGGGRRG
jgi:uncharacterized cupredoxin-like copper-binding protein